MVLSWNISHINASAFSPFSVTLTPTKQTELSAWIIVTAMVTFIGVINNIMVLIVTWPRASTTSGVTILIFHYVATNLFMNLINIPIGIFLIQARRDGHSIPANICNAIQ
ncbi:hypothetical protein BV898_19533, partial [Hypsibius exemplaris]